MLIASKGRRMICKNKAFLLGCIAGLWENNSALRDVWTDTKTITDQSINTVRSIVQIWKHPNQYTNTEESSVLFEKELKDVEFLQTVPKHLGITAKEMYPHPPAFDSHALTWAFITGFIEQSHSTINHYSQQQPVLHIESLNRGMLEFIMTFGGVPAMLSDSRHELSYFGTNCIDFLCTMYTHKTTYISTLFLRFIDWQTQKTKWHNGYDMERCIVFRTDPRAIVPSKARPSDVGYDLSIISEHKKLTSNVTLYDTGIRIRVPYGLYAEVVPRSSLSKSGYMLANSMGIIDASYTGNIYIALARIEENAQPIEYPFRCCQIIMRRQINVHMIETPQMFDETQRGSGGFGSSG